jgi:hypothetical protein
MLEAIICLALSVCVLVVGIKLQSTLVLCGVVAIVASLVFVWEVIVDDILPKLRKQKEELPPPPAEINLPLDLFTEKEESIDINWDEIPETNELIALFEDERESQMAEMAREDERCRIKDAMFMEKYSRSTKLEVKAFAIGMNRLQIAKFAAFCIALTVWMEEHRIEREARLARARAKQVNSTKFGWDMRPKFGGKKNNPKNAKSVAKFRRSGRIERHFEDSMKFMGLYDFIYGERGEEVTAEFADALREEMVPAWGPGYMATCPNGGLTEIW